MAGLLEVLPREDRGQIPAAMPPAGQEVNLIDPSNIGPRLLIVATVFLAILTIFFGLRVYAKAFIVKAYAWDDCKFVFPFRTSLNSLVLSDVPA